MRRSRSRSHAQFADVYTSLSACHFVWCRKWLTLHRFIWGKDFFEKLEETHAQKWGLRVVLIIFWLPVLLVLIEYWHKSLTECLFCGRCLIENWLDVESWLPPNLRPRKIFLAVINAITWVNIKTWIAQSLKANFYVQSICLPVNSACNICVLSN